MSSVTSAGVWHQSHSTHGDLPISIPERQQIGRYFSSISEFKSRIVQQKFQMNLLRKLMILTLMPLTAWSGIGQVACRCSNGEIRLHCPRMNQPKSAAAPSSNVCASEGGGCKSCCGQDSSTHSCCHSAKQATTKSKDQTPACCAETCHCTPVLLPGNGGAPPKTVSVPVLSHVEFLPSTVSVIRLPRIAQVDLIAIDTGPREPKDLIVLFERFLI